MNRSIHPKPDGFTLLEVLVSMVVFAIGMLGLAGMQGHALKDNNDAYQRSQAAFFAYDLGDRIRTNKIFWDDCILAADCVTPTTLASTKSTVEGFSSSSYPFCSTDNPPTASVGTDPTGCTIEELAQYDWYQARQNIINTLIDGQLDLSQATEDGEFVIEIKVSWKQSSTTVKNVGEGAGAMTHSFSYNVRP